MTKPLGRAWRYEISCSRLAAERGCINPLVARTTPPSSREIHWAAGFYEGEGSCGYWCSPTLKVAQRNREPLEKLQKFFGGRLHMWTRAMQHDKPRNYQYWQWSINGSRALGFAMTIYPLLSAKRQGQVTAMIRKARAKTRTRNANGTFGSVSTL